MKIGILTFVNTINYGAVLQGYALQKYLTTCGYIAELINYSNKAISQRESAQKKKLPRNPKALLKYLVMKRPMKKKRLKFDRYAKEYLVFGKEKYDCDNIGTLNEYDLIIVGSDQVWNLAITGNDFNFFLPFCSDNVKKVSYAASFGNNIFPDEYLLQAKEMIDDFDYVSVREQSGNQLLKEKMNINSEIVLDPTLLLNEDDWGSVIDFVPPIKNYILVYIPHNKKKVFDFVNKLRKQTGLKVVYINISPKKCMYAQNIYDASPNEFLGWLKNATYVVSGSFHGVAFSLNFQKQFFFEPTSEKGFEGRIDSLMKICGLSNRNIDECDADKNINYENVNLQLEKMRNDSYKYINDFLKGCDLVQ